ncbi:MAG: hypothetical protein PHY30_01705 [Candidatus Pacebacteria bacterium]|nr:hypothetical protein [Candidatus Paceibacterota bacterium]
MGFRLSLSPFEDACFFIKNGKQFSLKGADISVELKEQTIIFCLKGSYRNSFLAQFEISVATEDFTVEETEKKYSINMRCNPFEVQVILDGEFYSLNKRYNLSFLFKKEGVERLTLIHEGFRIEIKNDFLNNIMEIGFSPFVLRGNCPFSRTGEQGKAKMLKGIL